MNHTKVSLIISTYNWKEALNLCLKSIVNQTVLPNEIIVADDGSTDDTKAIIDLFRTKFPIDIIHVWQEDNGFQLAKIRNKAILKAKFDYIIQIDGDLILDKNFISDHLQFAKKNHFIRGSRVRLGEELSKKLLVKKSIKFSFFDKNIKSRFNGFRSYYVAKFLSKPSFNPHKMLGCNMAFWRHDALMVNGYENALVGWGHEDEEFAARLVNSNIAKIKLKHYAFVNHIYHIERERSNEERHNALIENAISNRKIIAQNGIKELDIP